MARAAVLAAAALAAAGASAGSGEVGRGTVDGEEAILFEDGTWRFADEDAVGRCDGAPALSVPATSVSFCLPGEWTREGARGDFDAAFVHEGEPDAWLGTVVGPGGWSNERLAEAVVSYARARAGVPVLEVVRDEPVTVDGADWHVVEFVAPAEGGDYTFWNVLRAGENRNVQLVFWTPKGDAEAAEPLLDAILGSVRHGGW